MTANRKNWVWIYGLVAIIAGKCEAVNLDLKLDLSAIHATAIIVPDFTNGQKAIDGDTSFGNTGVEKCATTNVEHSHILMSRYLKIDLKEQHYVTAIRLHLRDGLHRQATQNGLTVELSNSSLVNVKHLRCGETFIASKHGQSPFFPCFSKARHILIALRNTQQSLQICEVEVYQVPKLNLSENGHTELYPDVLKIGDSLAKPGNAIDGNTNIGQSGEENQILNCTSTELSTRTSVPRAYQYFSIRLSASKMVYFVRAHLRDNGYSPFVNRRADQDGLVVMISDDYARMNPAQCSPAYNSRKQGQSPAFTCYYGGQYLWIILNSTTGKSLQVCEVEVYATDLTSKCKDLSNLSIPNGRIIVSGKYLGSIAVYSCNRGYTVVGHARRKCQSTGMWSGFQPYCKLILCKRLLNPKHGYKINYGLKVGTVIRYRCMDGYELIGSSSRSCLLSGQWSGKKPVCQKETCNRLPNPKNGYRIGDGLSVGKFVAYVCKDGYKLIGIRSRSCLASGQWSETQPVCQKETCSRLPNPKDGYRIGDGLSVGTVIAYVCKGGYKLIGSRSRTCLDGGQWNGTQSVCQKETCNRLPNPKDGYRIGDGLSVGTVIAYVCKDGYRLIGSRSRSCLANGQWNGEQPVCQKNCEDLSKLKFLNGRVILRDNSATYSCNRGFEVVGVTVRQCQSTGEWTGAQPFCRLKTCKLLPNPNNGYRIGNNVTVGTNISFTCASGYVLIGSSSRECLASGNWSGRQPFCQPYCEVTDPANGYVTVSPTLQKSRLPLNTYVTYKCHEWKGYLINGTHRSIQLQCTGPGKWSKPIPICSLASCNHPENPANGMCTATARTFGSSKTCSCNHGYRLSNLSLATTTCEIKDSKVKWSGSTPFCQLALCDNLAKSNILHGTVIINGNSSEYRCNEGYELIGDIKRECQGNESWNETTPTCKIKMCKGLPYPKHGFTSSNESRPYSSTVSYTCELGYQLRYGNTVRECLSTGQWDGTQPICQSNCASNECRPFLQCTNNSHANNAWTCLDPSLCPSKLLSPVCGTDGVTYNNKCLMKVLSCKQDKSKAVEVAMQGRCGRVKKCKGLRHPMHGYISSTKRSTYGSIVSYTCDLGYQLMNGSRVRKCLTTSQWNGTQPICQKIFDCSKCHKDAECITNSYCHCKLGFNGNGKYCCSEDMGSKVTLTGSTAFFRCDKDCNIPYNRVTWFKDGIVINPLPKHYGLANDGILLYLENVKLGDSGQYSCLAHFSGATVKRYGTLEVLKSNVLSPSSLDCGKSCAKKSYVSDGVLTRAGQFPWQAMLCFPHFHGQYCGGVLVSPDCIVTAAHCATAPGPYIQNITTCLGRLCGNCSESDSQGKPQCSKPQTVHVHPQYNEETLDNDIAVMKLRQPATLNCASVLPVCLPNEARDAPYIGARKEGLVTGWGRVNSTVSRSICLRKGRVRLTSHDVCNIGHQEPITNSMLCATDHNGACEGDSGGPLIVKNTRYGGRYVLAGIVSWGIGCEDRKKLGVYTSVLSHLEWIKNTCGIRD